MAGPGPGPDSGPLFADEGVREFLSRKTVIEFPQKVLSPLRKQGSDPKALQESGGKDSSSSSSSSSSSDSESDEEGESADAGPRVASGGRGGRPKPQASRPLEDRAPGPAVSAKERTRSQPGLTSPEGTRQAKKKGGTIKPVEDRKDTKPKTTAPKSQVNKEFMKQNVKEKQLQKILRSNETDKESQKLPKVEKILPAHTKPGLSTQPAGGPAPIQLADRAGAAGPPARGGEVAVPLSCEESFGKQVPQGPLKATEELLESQAPGRSLQPGPAPNEGVLEDKAAGLEPEGGAGMAEEPAPPGGPDSTQGIPSLALLRSLFPWRVVSLRGLWAGAAGAPAEVHLQRPARPPHEQRTVRGARGTHALCTGSLGRLLLVPRGQGRVSAHRCQSLFAWESDQELAGRRVLRKGS